MPLSTVRKALCARLRRHRRPLFVLAVVALLAQMAFAMVTTAVQQTPTIDEPVYVGTAVVYEQQHSLRYNPEHPPLGKLLIAVGTTLADPHLDPGFTGDQTRLGRHLLYESGNDPWRLMLWARLPVIAVTLLTGLVVLAFASDLLGRVAGLAALALYAFSPDVIAHGSLATLDVPAAGLLLTTAWLLWRARRRPRLYLPLAGVALGAAVATRMSVLPLVPVLLLLGALSYWHAHLTPGPARHGRMRLPVRATAAAVAMAVIAVAVVWAAYLAVDPRLRWTTPPTVPDIRGVRGFVAHWLPLPEPYRDGMRVQFGIEYSTKGGGFLLGRRYFGSLWYYLPVALLIKTPLGMLALWLAGTSAVVAVPRLRAAIPYILVPPTLLMAVLLDGSRDFGTRYAIFMPMFLAVVASCVLALRRSAARRWAYPATAALILFVAVSSLRTYPYYIPYSNEAFGGTAKTRLRLHDSNVDWGQDLGRLADRLDDRYPGERVWLVYKGSGVPAYYGIDAADPLRVPANDVHGLLVVSDSAAAKAEPGGPVERLVRSSEPVDEVGHSITIYRRP
ncbi:phospholipid carrier-dependent glycosyltransferase [Streptomyces cavernae]|uniref:phospholipid carrier-dependent glycosyltransferase n=1 Tax=Streptomyces cavernae TaxID=2259034 RepID=UPI000FEBAF30|nr:phospholipid carrier-dependent glycosyltransferase [Streptomyces cavernae]